MCLRFHIRVVPFFGMLKKKYLHEIGFFSEGVFSQVYLIWAPKLGVPKIGIPLFKSIWNTPSQISEVSGSTFHLVFNAQKIDGFNTSIMLLRSNMNSAKKSVIMQKRHSHTTFFENIRCFSLSCHFSRKNLMG